MITLKMALKSVIRRPRQNIAVILGIALGVSLFVGVQVGSDSLGGGFRQQALHSLGQTDASISPTLSPYFISNDIINEELGGNDAPDILDNLQNNATLNQYIESIVERLQIGVTALQPESGSIEINKQLIGISPSETGFGNLYNEAGEILDLADLDDSEIYIGESTAEQLFLDDNPVGQNLTLQTTLFSNAPIGTNFNSSAVPFQLNMTIVDVFMDEGKGRENIADYIATPLSWLQNKVATAFDNADLLISEPVLGYGGAPINQILVNWKDSIQTGEESNKATEVLKNAFFSIVSKQFSQFYSVQDIRSNLEDNIESFTEQFSLLLNAFGSIIIVAGVLVIINIQNLALAAREKETGITRAIGASKRQIIIANLLESMFLGIIGSLVGLLGGIAYGRLLVFFLGYAFEFDTGDIPTVVTQETLVTSFIAGFAISQVTGLIPAIQASRINVAQVLRGIDPPEQPHFGKKSLYLGFTLTFIAIATVIQIDPNPLIDGKDAFRNLSDAEDNFLAIASLIIGPSLLFAYYKSKKAGLTVAALSLLGWAYFNVLVVFDWIEEGSGGILYILSLIGALLIGSIVLIAQNLGTIAALGQKLFSFLARSSETPIRGTSMVAFRKMKSNITRSTLTFSLFAVILTMNIFIGTWGYSFRYGYDDLVIELSGGADTLFYAGDNTVPESLDFSQELLDEFGDASRDVQLTHVRGYTVISNARSYLFGNQSEEPTSTRLISMDQTSLWADEEQSDWIFRFNLQDDKNGTPYETGENLPEESVANEEDENVWKALTNGSMIPNKEGELKPVIVTSLLGEFSPTGLDQTHEPGDSVYLNLTDGSLQEFVIGAISSGNPIADFNPNPVEGPPQFGATFYVGEEWKDKLNAFQGYRDQENYFLGETNIDDITSSEIAALTTEVEEWANKNDGEFREEHGLYGIIGVSVYSIYEGFLESQYRFLGFLQAFVSLGFAVGVLGLLVVASRSVAERKREIGMLRALGFRRLDIVISVVLELVVMGLIGLFIGFVNGTIMGYALTDINSGGDATFLIPWWLVGLYGGITLVSAIGAAIFPAIQASKIPASDALRYTG